jgi:hypothetical protein
MRNVRVSKKKMNRRSSRDTPPAAKFGPVTSREDLLARVDRVLAIIDECDVRFRNA